LNQGLIQSKQWRSQNLSIRGLAGVWGRNPSRWRPFGVWGQSPAAGGWGFGAKPSTPGGKGDCMEAEPPAAGDFFNKKTHFYAYFGQNSYFKAITLQLKGFKSV